MDHRPITIPPPPQVPTVWAYLTGTKMKRWMKDSKGSTPSALNLVAKPMSLHTHWLRALSLRTIIISLPFPSTGFPSTPFVLLVSAPSCMPTQQTDFHTVWQIPLGTAGKVYLIQTNHSLSNRNRDKMGLGLALPVARRGSSRIRRGMPGTRVHSMSALSPYCPRGEGLDDTSVANLSTHTC